MLIEFRQGIYQQQNTPTFITFTGAGVNINAENAPTIVTFAHGRSNYLITEDKSITGAWSGPFPKNKKSWLYWDIDLTTGKRTFGYTTVDPFTHHKGYGSSLPNNPKSGQHFFLTTENKMKYFSGQRWKTVIRAFAGVVRQNAQLDVFESGTQIGSNTHGYAGHILFNHDNTPIKKSGLFDSGEFFTTETGFSPQNDSGNVYKVDSIQVSTRAMEPVPKFHCVNLKGNKLLGLASYENPAQPCIGIALEDFVKGHIGRIVTHGIVENPDFWNFTEPYGTSIWIGPTGQVTTDVPQLSALQKIGYVVNPTTIYVDIRQVVKIIEYDDDCFVPSATPTPTPAITPTLTPTMTVTPALTVTPTQTVTPTSTAAPTVTPTQTVTVTPTVTPTMTTTPSTVAASLVHEWKIAEDLGSTFYDTGDATPVDIPTQFGDFGYSTIQREVRTYVIDNTGVGTTSMIPSDAGESVFPASIPSTGDNWSYTMWVRPVHSPAMWDWPSHYQSIIDGWGGIGYEEFSHCMATNVLVGNGVTGLVYSSANSVPRGVWTHVAVVFSDAGADHKNISYYINGVLDKTHTPAVYHTNFSLTGIAGTVSDFFTGNLSHIRVYDYPLDSIEVLDVYNEYTVVEEDDYRATINQTKIYPERNVLYDKHGGFTTWPLDNAYAYGMHMRSDDSMLYYVGSTHNAVHRMDFDTPEDITTAHNGHNTVMLYDTWQTSASRERGIFRFTSDGASIFKCWDNVINEFIDSPVTKLTCGTAWELSTARDASVVQEPATKVPRDVIWTELSNDDVELGSIQFSTDGSKAYFGDINNWAIFQFNCSPAFDIETMVYAGYYPTYADAIEFSSDGGTMYALGGNIAAYTLGTPWDITTAVYDADVYTLPTNYQDDIKFNADGSKFYTIEGSSVREYNMSVAFDIKTATTGASFNISTSATALNMSSDGTKFYFVTTPNMRQFTASTPWDVTTLVYDDVIEDLGALEPSSHNSYQYFDFKSDGTKVWAVSSNYYVDEYTLLTPWDIDGMSWTSTNVPELSPYSFQLKPDGTAYYSMSIGTDVMTEFQLSTPWDLSTASYLPQSFDMTNEFSNPQDMFFKPDGLEMYLNSSTQIYQYTLTVAWDLSTASFTGQYDTAVVTNSLTGIHIKNDGTKMFCSDSSTNYVYEYTIGTPWDITTASYSGNSLYVNSQDATAINVTVSDDGSSFYMVGDSNNRVYQYTCPTPWTLSGASYSGKNLDSSPQTTSPKAMWFQNGSGGTVMYLIDWNGEVNQFTLSVGWDMSTAVHDAAATMNLPTPTSYFSGMTFDSGGNYMFISTTTPDIVIRYTMSTPWNIQTATTGSNQYYMGDYADPRAGYINPDGSGYWVYDPTDQNADLVYFTMGTPWDLTTSAHDAPILLLTGQDANTNGMAFKPDGTKLYVSGGNSDQVFQYTLSTPWDITTAVYDAISGVIASGLNGSLQFKSDGTKAYTAITSLETDFIELGMNSAWDITTLTEDKGYYEIAEDTDARAVSLDSTGTTMFVLGNQTNSVYQYTLATAWKLDNTLSYDSISLDVTTQDATPTGMYVKPDGTKLYILGDATDAVYQYNLPTPWSLTGATYDSVSFGVKGTVEYGVTYSLTFKPDGTKMYVGQGQLYQYTLSTPWDITTAVLSDHNFSTEWYSYDAPSRGYAFSSTGTKLYLGKDIRVDQEGITQWSVSTPWDVSNQYASTAFNGDTSMAVSPDGNTVVGYYRSDTSSSDDDQFIVHRRNAGVWSVYATLPGFGNVTRGFGIVEVSNNGRYIFMPEVGTNDTIDVYEDQLDGTYALINNTIPATTSLTNLSISDDGTLLSFGNIIYRQSDATTWTLEQTVTGDLSTWFLSDPDHCQISGDGSRILVHKSNRTNYDGYKSNCSYTGQEKQVWKHNGSSWVPEGVLPLSSIVDILLNDTYYGSASASMGEEDWEVKSVFDINYDGSVIVMNYIMVDTSQRVDGYATTINGVLAWRETSPGVWGDPHIIRSPVPLNERWPGDSENDPGCTIAVSASGDRLLYSHFDSDWTNGGGKGKLYVYDWNATSGKYEYTKFIEPMESYYGDIFASFQYLSGDGRYGYTHGQTGWEDFGQHGSGYQQSYEGITSYAGVMFQYDIGPEGSLPAVTMAAPQYDGFVVNETMPYGTKPRHMPLYSYFVNSDSRELVFNSMYVRHLSTVNTNGIRSVLAHNTGKVYAEMLYKADDFGGNVPGMRAGIGMYVDGTRDFTDIGSLSSQYVYDTRGLTWNNNVSTGATALHGKNSILGIAVDCDTNEVWFSLNGVWLDGDPATGTSPTFTMTEPTTDYKYIILGNLQGTGAYDHQTEVTLRVSDTEFENTPPTGFSPWDSTTQVGEWGYASIVKYHNPTNYWRFADAPGGIVSDDVGINNLTLWGDQAGSVPTISHDYGFHEAGSLSSHYVSYPGYRGWAELDTEITRTHSEGWTVSFLIYPQEVPGNAGFYSTIWSSSDTQTPGKDSFGMSMSDNGDGSLTLDVVSYTDATGYRYRTSNYDLYHNRWQHVALVGKPDGTLIISVDSQLTTTTYFDTAEFGLFRIGGDVQENNMHGYIAEFAYYDRALDGSAGTLNGVERLREMHQLAYGAVLNYRPSFNGPPIGGWPGPGDSDDQYLTRLKSLPIIPSTDISSNRVDMTITAYDTDVTPKPVHVVSPNYESMVLTAYDSTVGPSVNDVTALTFDTFASPDVTAFIATGPAGTGVTSGPSTWSSASRKWGWWNAYPTWSTRGPTSDQEGIGGGYLYPEVYNSLNNDVFTLEYDTTIDASATVDIWTVEFWTNQRGTGSQMYCQLQVNEGGAGWVDIGPELGGPDDPDQVDTGGTDYWVHRTVDMTGVVDPVTRIRWLFTNGPTGVTYENYYGIDTITISRIKLR